MNDRHREIEANELLFVQQHRSAVWDLGPGRLFVSSQRDVETWNFVGALAGDHEPWEAFVTSVEGICADWQMTPCVKLTPFSPPTVEPFLVARGWQEGERLTYMVLPGPARIGAGTADVSVRVCTTPAEVRTFSEVQAAGFGALEWVDWVHRVNVLNVTRSNQRFYVAWREGEPVGVCLLVLSGAVGGLYAVTTVEAARGRGVSRALCARAAADAVAAGATTVCLDTDAAGKARDVFRRMGFEDAFDSRFFVRRTAERTAR